MIAPSVVITETELLGLRHEGLFRLSGSQIAIQALKERFDSGSPLVRCSIDDHLSAHDRCLSLSVGFLAGENVDLLNVGDVHTVGSLLKLWFRELPEPLLTYELYDCFLAAAGTLSCLVLVLFLPLCVCAGFYPLHFTPAFSPVSVCSAVI